MSRSNQDIVRVVLVGNGRFTHPITRIGRWCVNRTPTSKCDFLDKAGCQSFFTKASSAKMTILLKQ
jgi:hypothetical protein